MRTLALAVPSLVLGLGLVGCEVLPEDAATGDSGLDDTGAEPTHPDDDRGHGRDPQPETTGASTPAPAGWTLSAHPCFGNRTDTMLIEDDRTVWVGCGSTTEGKGLYRSDDGGRSWGSAGTFFSQFRVSSITRSTDGLLYVAGIDTTSVERVVSLDDDGNVAEVFAAGDQVWNSFHVGTFLRNGEGIAVAESLTGTGLVARFGDGNEWQDAGHWWGGGSESFQVLDLVLFEDGFYGVGSTLTQPPYVYLPPEGGLNQSTGFTFDILELAAGPMPFDGELYGIAVDGEGLVVAGVDQDHHTGYVFWSGRDPWAAWRALEVSSMVGGDPTWMRGTCRRGDTIVAVGEYSQRGTGLVLRSDDGGDSWRDVTPTTELPPGASFPPVQKCTLLGDGDLVVTGAEGLFATFAAR